VADSAFLQPGEPAPVAGRYAEYDLFGAVTCFALTVEAGAKLPWSPLNFTWRLAAASPTLRFRVRRRPARYSPRAAS
jgi:hypothetical protein